MGMLFVNGSRCKSGLQYPACNRGRKNYAVGELIVQGRGPETKRAEGGKKGINVQCRREDALARSKRGEPVGGQVYGCVEKREARYRRRERPQTGDREGKRDDPTPPPAWQSSPAGPRFRPPLPRSSPAAGPEGPERNQQRPCCSGGKRKLERLVDKVGVGSQRLAAHVCFFLHAHVSCTRTDGNPLPSRLRRILYRQCLSFRAPVRPMQACALPQGENICCHGLDRNIFRRKSIPLLFHRSATAPRANHGPVTSRLAAAAGTSIPVRSSAARAP